jgi:ribosomal protein L32
MFLSPLKLLVLLLLVGVVWTAIRFTNRVDQIRRGVREEVKRRRQQAQKPRSLQAEDLVKCAACGAYVAAHGASSCGRADCPWGR